MSLSSNNAFQLTRMVSEKQDPAELVLHLAKTGWYTAIIEFIANELDADGKIIRVDLDLSGKGKLSFSGNGHGMNRELLNGFYALGGSHKREDDTSPEGRPYIGQFGIASILLKQLGKRYTLSTKRDGTELRVTEEFGDGPLDSKRPIDVVPYMADTSEHGTTIVIEDLNFLGKKSFSERTLKKRLQWDLPPRVGYQLLYNGEISEPTVMQDSTGFPQTLEGALMGKVHGEIHATKRKAPFPGMHIYCRGRRAANIGEHVFTKMGFGASNNVIGILHADKLNDAILFNRTGFDLTHKGVEQLIESLEKPLGEIRSFLSRQHKRASISAYQSNSVTWASDALNKLRRHGIPEIHEETKVELKSLGDEEIGRYSNRMFIVNRNFPSLQTTKRQEYVHTMMHLLIDILAKKKQEGDDMASFVVARNKLWEKLRPKLDLTDTGMLLYPGASYIVRDLVLELGWPANTFKYLVEGGALERERGRIKGSNVLDMLRATNYTLPLHAYANKHVGGVGAGPFIERVEHGLSESGSAIEPYAYKYGSCYFIEPAVADMLLMGFKGHQFDRRKGGLYNPSNMFKQLGEESWTAQDLVTILDNHPIEEITRVRKYWVEHRGTLAKNGEYNLSQFVKAIQYRRTQLNIKRVPAAAQEVVEEFS